MLLGREALDFCQELAQEQQLVSILGTIGVLLGLDNRFEIENTHTELRDVEHSGSFNQRIVEEIFAHRTQQIDTPTARSQEMHSQGAQPGSVRLEVATCRIEVVRLQCSQCSGQTEVVLLRGEPTTSRSSVVRGAP